MPFLTTAAIAATAAVAGTAIAGVSAYEQSQSQKQASAASRQAEALRQQQMELDNRRRMTQLIRTAAAARAQAVSGSVARGLSTTDSSVMGGESSIQSQAGANILAQAQNINIGRGLFAANAAYSEAKSDAQTWNAAGDFGKTLFQNSQQIGQIGETLFAPKTVGNWSTTVQGNN